MNNKFKIESGKMILTDPCYEKKTWCTKTIPARNGEWSVDVTIGPEGRVAELTARHSGYFEGATKTGEDITLDDLGVDSGQMGFFDEAKYPKTKKDIGDYDDKESFYGKCCETTLAKPKYGVIDDFGCVSSTGYGDGSYDGYAETDEDGNAVFVQVIFIDVDDDDDDNQSEFDEDLD